jgi:hypothetical protein
MRGGGHLSQTATLLDANPVKNIKLKGLYHKIIQPPPSQSKYRALFCRIVVQMDTYIAFYLFKKNPEIIRLPHILLTQRINAPHVRQPTRIVRAENGLPDVHNKVDGFDLPNNGGRLNYLLLNFPETNNWFWCML